MKNFTIFLNSRGRVNQLKRFVSVVENKTLEHRNLELIITADNDDPETLDFIEELKNKDREYLFNPIIGNRPKSLCWSYNNMTRRALGEYCFVMNDDAEIQTDNWDIIALEKITEFKLSHKIKDDIIFLATHDTSVDKPVNKVYSSFPIISKQAIDTLGFFMHDNFVGLGGDSAITKVYEGVGRMIDTPEIVVDHVYHNTIFKVMAPDKTAAEMRANTYANPVDPFNFDVKKDIEVLANFIKKYEQ